MATCTLFLAASFGEEQVLLWCKEPLASVHSSQEPCGEMQMLKYEAIGNKNCFEAFAVFLYKSVVLFFLLLFSLHPSQPLLPLSLPLPLALPL